MGQFRNEAIQLQEEDCGPFRKGILKRVEDELLWFGAEESQGTVNINLREGDQCIS